MGEAYFHAGLSAIYRRQIPGGSGGSITITRAATSEPYRSIMLIFIQGANGVNGLYLGAISSSSVHPCEAIVPSNALTVTGVTGGFTLTSGSSANMDITIVLINGSITVTES